MPQPSKTRKFLLYTYITLQVLLNVTFTNAAVIREKREIAANVTGITTSNNEVDSTTTTTAAEDGTGFNSTTGKSLTYATSTDVIEEKQTTTLTGSTVDKNTVSFTSDGSEHYSDSKDEQESEKDDDVRSPKINSYENTTVHLNEETSTVDDTQSTVISNDKSRSELTTDSESILELESSTADQGKTESTVPTEIKQISEVTLASESVLKKHAYTTDEDASGNTVQSREIKQTTVPTTTISTDVQQIETTGSKTAREGTTLSTQQLEELTTEVSMEQSSDDISRTFVTKSQNSPDESSKTESTTNLTTITKPSQESATPLFVEDKTLANDTTVKPDETTLILTSSTETSDENPVQATFYPSPLIQDSSVLQEIQNSTPTSAEKRGKFIDDNYNSPNELRLPNTSDVWALAGMKSAGKLKSSEIPNSVETSDEKVVNNSMVTKSLLDWSRIMMSTATDAMESEITVKVPAFAENTTTAVPLLETTTEMRTVQENEVNILTTKIPTEVATEVVNLLDKIEIQKLIENEVKPETTTSLSVKEEENTAELLTGIDDSSVSQTDDILLTTKSTLNLLKGRDDSFIEDNQVDSESVEEQPPLPTITTTTSTSTSIPAIATVKSETSKEENAGTILTSTLSLLDFTTSMPFLTSTTTTTTTTTTPVAITTIPSIAFNMDDKTNEPPNMESTLTPSSEAVAAAAATAATTTTIEPAITTTTTTTTIPAVTVMAATTEIQTTETHTPAIISNNDTNTMTQKSNNYNNYEVVVNKTTTKFADNSSVEASEAYTRVAPNWATSTTEVESSELDEFRVTIASNFENNNAYEVATPQPSTTVDSTFTFVPTPIPTVNITTTTSTSTDSNSTTTEDLDHIDSIHKISDTAETSIESNVIDSLQAGEASTTTTTTPTTITTTSTTTTTTIPATATESIDENMRMHSTDREEMDTSSSSTTTASYDDSMTTLQSISTKKEDIYSIVPTIDSGGFLVPKLIEDDAATTMSGELATGIGDQSMNSPDVQETDVNVIIAISVSVVGIVALILLVAFLYVMRKRQKQMSYGQRCRPVSLDAYSLDNVSVYNSVRRKGATLRASKRSYGNVAFDDPSLRHNVLGTHELAKYVEKKSSIWDEFKDVPQIIARADEVPAGCEDRNRYANVIPLPETRVILQQQNGDEKSEYINANYVRGPKDTTNYYIACQAPLETTVTDFWRMIWEQNSRVIIMATDLIENGIEKCAEYLPPSVTLDNHTVFGDFQVTLKNREVKEKYAISTLMLKNTATEESREITHYWYRWPEAGIPADEAAIIAMLLEARSSLKLYTIEQIDTKTETIITEESEKSAKSEINGNAGSEKPKPPPRDQGPLTIHCSPGTGRTGTILSCDIAMRCLEEPKRCVDIPQIVYSVRRGRASAVQTKEQYEFIYKVTHMYATKISNLHNDN